MEGTKTPARTTKGGPDQGYAWVVAIACFTINFIMAGLARTAGVLYVALIDLYGVSRESATTPFSIRVCVRNMTGPLIGLLGQRYGIRPITTIGAIFAAVGGMLCFAAPNVFWITIFWGVIHGIGFGLSTVLHMMTIHQYFDKYKASAMGFGFSGDCVGSFVFPVLLEFLIDTYGVKGTFLILGGIVLNVLPAALLLKTPPWLEEAEKRSRSKQQSNKKIKTEKSSKQCSEPTKELVFNQWKVLKYYPYNVSDICRGLPVQLINLPRRLSVQHTERTRSFSSPKAEHDKQDCFKATNGEQMLAVRQNLGSSFKENHLVRELENQQEDPSNESSTQYRMYIIESHHTIFCQDESPLSVSYANKGFVPSSLSIHQAGRTGDVSAKESSHLCDKQIPEAVPELSSCRSHKGSVSSYKSLPPKTLNILATVRNVVVSPMFNLISMTMAVYALLFVTVVTIIIDFCLDKGISQQEGKYLIIGFSAADLFGRLSFGGIMDRKLLPLHSYATLTVTAMAGLVAVIPWCPNFPTLMGVMISYGLIQGGTAIMFPILIGNYMKEEEANIAMGCMNFYGGLIMLGMAPMIGYFRDQYGSYDGIFYIIGGITAFTGCIWLLEPLIMKFRNNGLTEENGIPSGVTSCSEKL